jgi:hypothetical protein
MAFDRLVLIGSKNPVPPGEGKAVIAVSFFKDDGVVNPVHVRGDNQKTDNAVKRLRDIYIAVIEQSCGV